MATHTDELLRAVLTVTARAVFPPDKLVEIVAPTGTSKVRQQRIAAFNLCDGTRTQAQVVKQLGLHQGNFSESVSRWVKAGIMFRLGGEGGDTLLLHVYPLPPGAGERESE